MSKKGQPEHLQKNKFSRFLVTKMQDFDIILQ